MFSSEIALEQAINIFMPEIPGLPDISLEEEFRYCYDRPKNQKISIVRDTIEIFCEYEGIAMILCDRLIQNNEIFLSWGIKEINIFFANKPPSKIFVT